MRSMGFLGDFSQLFGGVEREFESCEVGITFEVS